MGYFTKEISFLPFYGGQETLVDASLDIEHCYSDDFHTYKIQLKLRKLYCVVEDYMD